MSPITTHILDTALGKPASGVTVVLHRAASGQLQPVGQGVTDGDGRIKSLMKTEDYAPGEYIIEFDTAGYFNTIGCDVFYPSVSVRFIVAAGQAHYHVPLLLSPYGYSTYRGS